MPNDFEMPKEVEVKRKKPDTPSITLPDGKKEKEEATPKEKSKYDQDELDKIFDEILFMGEYSESVKIKGKMNVTFRTRTADEVKSITDRLDASPANLVDTIQERRALFMLHAALTHYQGKNLSEMKYEDRAKFINGLAGVILGLLVSALSKFDAKCYEACKEGEENF